MSTEIIGLHRWFDSPPGRYLLAWEQARFDEAVADVFGYHSLQIGMPLLDGLRTNRMPHRWLALDELPSPGPGVGPAPDLLAHAVALPFPDNSLDLVLLPHALELSHDPHVALREVARGLRQQRVRLYQRLSGGRGRLYLPDVGEFISAWRLRDWLRLLNFEVEPADFGCYRPAVRSEHWMERFAWMERVGERCWPILGAGYFVVGVKRVHGMRLMEPAWRTHRQRATASIPVARNATDMTLIDRNSE